MNSDVFLRYLKKRRLDVWGKSDGQYTVAVYAQKIPPDLWIFLTCRLGGTYIGEVIVITARERLTALIFRLPPSEEVEAIKRPFVSGKGIS